MRGVHTCVAWPTRVQERLQPILGTGFITPPFEPVVVPHSRLPFHARNLTDSAVRAPTDPGLATVNPSLGSVLDPIRR
jgi:hypothetical protein